MYSLEQAREILSTVLVIGSAVCACGDNPHVRHFEEGGKGDRSIDCKGYTVEGAGNSSFNGCYLPSNETRNGQTQYVLDNSHILFQWRGGAWGLGKPGSVRSYTAGDVTAYPPVVTDNVPWETCDLGVNPPPYLTRSAELPPIPTPAPVPPPTPVPPVPPLPPMQLVFEDEFNEAVLNESSWNVMEQVHRDGVYTRDNVFVRNGSLVLRTIARNTTVERHGKLRRYYISTGGVNTSGRLDMHRGRWSVRAKLPDADRSPGYTLHAAIWLKADASQAVIDPALNKSLSGCGQEIDIMEQNAAEQPTSPSRRTVARGTIHPYLGGHPHAGAYSTKPYAPCEKQPAELQYQRDADYTSDWHVWTVDWTAAWVVMSIDGVAISVFDKVAALTAFTDPLFLALTSAVMHNIAPTSLDVLPQEFLVDWVRVWRWTG